MNVLEVLELVLLRSNHFSRLMNVWLCLSLKTALLAFDIWHAGMWQFFYSLILILPSVDAFFKTGSLGRTCPMMLPDSSTYTVS